jgi:hypothetical protein
VPDHVDEVVKAVKPKESIQGAHYEGLRGVWKRLEAVFPPPRWPPNQSTLMGRRGQRVMAQPFSGIPEVASMAMGGPGHSDPAAV